MQTQDLTQELVSFHGRAGVQVWLSQILLQESNHYNILAVSCDCKRLTHLDSEVDTTYGQL